ncbi:MAG: murein hydrolase activator EnvC family protein [Bacteroidales bacterium]
MTLKAKSKTFWKKLKFKYKLSILNEKTLEDVFAFRLSLLSVIYAGAVLFIVTLVVVSSLIATTPLKNYLPGYLDINARQDIQKNALKVDSLVEIVALQEKYLAQVKSVLSGNIAFDSLTTNIDSLNNIDPEKLKATEDELDFRKQYEEDEKYNLSIKPTVHDDARDLAFSRPAKGTIMKSFNPARKLLGITLSTPPQSVVMAVLLGDVILTGRQENGLKFIQVMHQSGFVSIYKNCSEVLKQVGSSVSTGEAIANSDDKAADRAAHPFMFELWYKGKPVDPTHYILF